MNASVISTDLFRIKVSTESDPPGSATETPHQRVFRLVSERRYEEAARLAKPLIDADRASGFFIRDGTTEMRRARDWLSGEIDDARHAPTSGFHRITPQRAQALLEANADNRYINSAALAERMRDVAEGRWEENGQSIIVSKCGFLNDGQHRMWAVLLTGLGIRSNVAFGLKRETRNTVDMGAVRTGADRLKFDGVNSAAAKAAVARLAFQMLNGRAPSRLEEQEYYHNNRVLMDLACDVVTGVVRGTSPTAFRVAAFYLLLNKTPADDIKQFFADVKNGNKSRTRGCAAFSLREALTTYKVKLPRDQWARSAVWHFCYWTAGRSSAKLLDPAVLSIPAV
ncbi:hypothetical protein ACUSIJ_24825 [Pseudochelatococcus sp. B33]